MSRSREGVAFQRAVIEHAIVWGWHVPPAAEQETTDPLPGLVFHPRVMIGSEMGWPDLTLVRRRDRRLIFAELATDRATSKLSPRKRLVMDLLGSLEWDRATDEQRRAEQALGHPVPRVETFVWRPADLVAGTIDAVLR